MDIKDRGKIKWQPAHFMPEQVSLLNQMYRDERKQPKQILDDYQIQEIESKIHFAMEFALPIKFTVWEDGFEWEYDGLVHRLDSISKMIFLENKERYIVKIKFDDVVKVEVVDS